MGFLDTAKQKLTGVVDKHGDKINLGLDKAASAADKRTGGKHADKIRQGVAHAKKGLDSLDGRADDLTRGRTVPTSRGGVTSPTAGETQHPAGKPDPSAPTKPEEPKAPTGPMGNGTPGNRTGGTAGLNR